MSNNRYINEFLSLRCAGDVLNCYPGGLNKGAKEISESMAIINAMRYLVNASPMQYTLYDIGAGNALTSLIAVHLLPIKRAIAIDRKPRKLDTRRVERFFYIAADAFSEVQIEHHPAIIISVHPCKALAERVVEIYRESRSNLLFIMPCCVGKLKGVPENLISRDGRYKAWCWKLAIMADGMFYEDGYCNSACNQVVFALRHLRGIREYPDDVLKVLQEIHGIDKVGEAL